jgi:hypothetical protein
MATLAYGAANYAATLAPTLIMSGTTALIGGLIVVGLAAVVSRIRRLAEALDRQPLPRIAGERFDVGRFAPRDRDPPTPVVTPTARAETEAGTAVDVASDVPPPDIHQGVEHQDVEAEAAAPATEPSAVTVQVADVKQPKPAEIASAPPLPAWPGVPRRELDQAASLPKVDRREDAPILSPRRERYEPVLPSARSVEAPADPVQASPPAPAPIILKSGVLDGMAYTLYSDGSIEAELREGTMRFGSIPELRAYIFEQAR